MNIYGGHYAGVYDLVFSEKDYEKEVNWILARMPAGDAGECRKVLDLACGTGRHLEHFGKAGLDLCGIDQSGAMLEKAEQRLQAAGLTARLGQKDMGTLPEAAEEFDLVLCAFDSIGYLISNARILSFLRQVAGRLRTGGIFVFDFWHSAAMSRHFEPCRVKRVKGALGEEVTRISETSIDWGRQVATVDYTFFTDGPAPGCSSVERHENRFFSVPEMDLFLETAGFVTREYFAGYGEKRPMGDQDWHIVAVAGVL